MENYILIGAAILLVFLIIGLIRKVTSCLFRGLLLAGGAAVLYYLYTGGMLALP